MKKLILLTSLLLSGFGLQGRGCLLGGICVDEAQDKAQFEQCVAEGGEVYDYLSLCKGREREEEPLLFEPTEQPLPPEPPLPE